jgi:hypothetical protein
MIRKLVLTGIVAALLPAQATAQDSDRKYVAGIRSTPPSATSLRTGRKARTCRGSS